MCNWTSKDRRQSEKLMNAVWEVTAAMAHMTRCMSIEQRNGLGMSLSHVLNHNTSDSKLHETFQRGCKHILKVRCAACAKFTQVSQGYAR